MSLPGSASESGRGALAAATCYLAWGLFPLYWKQLSAISSTELIAHRHLSSLVFVLVVMGVGREWGDLLAALRSRTALKWHALSGGLLTAELAGFHLGRE